MFKLEWDEAKRSRNLSAHGVDFTLIEGFAWAAALTREDLRADYGEARFVSISLIGDRHFVAVWTRRGDTLRLISLRKANTREVKIYERS